MRQTPAQTRLDWRPTPDQWIEIGRSYCPMFHAAMLAIAAIDAERRLTASDGFDVKNGKPVGVIVAAERRVADAKAAFDERRVVAGHEDRDAEWTFERRKADLEYETSELDRLRDETRPLVEFMRNANRDFSVVTKRNHLPCDLNDLAQRGRQWQADIRDMTQWYRERVEEEYALAYRRTIADAARALLDAMDAPIDPHARVWAMSDIKRCMRSIDEDVLSSTISAVRNLSYAAREAANDFADEIEGEFAGGSPWGQWILDMRSWARGNGLPCEIGRAAPAKGGRYADFAEFLLAIDGTLPKHLRRGIAKSTFVRRAHEAVHSGNKSTDSASKA